MRPALIAVATALFAITTLGIATAEAGHKVRLEFGGPLPSFTAHGNAAGYGDRDRRTRRHKVRRKARSKAKVRAVRIAPAHKPFEPANTADAPKAPTQATAETENSSISPAGLPGSETKAADEAPAAPAAATKPKTIERHDCKRFFPSVGMTLTVPCP